MAIGTKIRVIDSPKSLDFSRTTTAAAFVALPPDEEEGGCDHDGLLSWDFPEEEGVRTSSTTGCAPHTHTLDSVISTVLRKLANYLIFRIRRRKFHEEVDTEGGVLETISGRRNVRKRGNDDHDRIVVFVIDDLLVVGLAEAERQRRSIVVPCPSCQWSSSPDVDGCQPQPNDGTSTIGPHDWRRRGIADDGRLQVLVRDAAETASVVLRLALRHVLPWLPESDRTGRLPRCRLVLGHRRPVLVRGRNGPPSSRNDLHDLGHLDDRLLRRTLNLVSTSWTLLRSIEDGDRARLCGRRLERLLVRLDDCGRFRDGLFRLPNRAKFRHRIGRLRDRRFRLVLRQPHLADLEVLLGLQLNSDLIET